MGGRVTQEFLESTDTGASKARVSQVFVESTDTGAATARVTQVFLEYIDKAPVPGGGGSGLLTFVGP
jgi:hypothetical protein